MSIAFHALCSFQEFQTQTDEETNFLRHFTNIKLFLQMEWNI